jgi:hypothetical protein
LIEQQAEGSKEKLLRNKKAKQLRRRCHAQHPQGIHERVVKKFEKGETTAHVELHKKQVPNATREANNKNKEKGENSSINVVCTNDLSMTSKRKKRIGKRRFYKCKELGHLIASCPHMDTEEMLHIQQEGSCDHVMPSHEESRTCIPQDDSHHDKE